MKRFLLAALFFAVLLLIWEVLFRAKIWSPVLLPSPRQVAVYLEGAAVDGTLAKAIIVTMRRLLIGYIIGLLVGLPLGLLTARWKVLQDTIGTLALGLQTLPSVCWVPLALLWFGQTEAAMLFVVVMGTLWSVVIATETGVRNVPPMYTQAGRNFGLSTRALIARVIFPAVLPRILVGLRIAFGVAWLVLVAAEMIAVDSGLGYLIIDARNAGKRYDLVVGGMLLIGVIGLALDALIVPRS